MLTKSLINTQVRRICSEIEVLKDLVEVLRPLESATSEIRGQHYVKGSLAIPITHITKEKLNCLEPKMDMGKEFLKQVLQKFSKRFSNIEQTHLLAIATILEPRFKKIYFGNPLHTQDTLL